MATLLWFFLFVYFVIPFPCLHIHDRDGKLKEADQILAINGQALDQTITHQQAISILQKAKDNVQLVVARGTFPQLISPVVSRSPSAASTVSAHSNPVSTPQTSVYSVLGMYALTASSILRLFFVTCVYISFTVLEIFLLLISVVRFPMQRVENIQACGGGDLDLGCIPSSHLPNSLYPPMQIQHVYLNFMKLYFEIAVDRIFFSLCLLLGQTNFWGIAIWSAPPAGWVLLCLFLCCLLVVGLK